MTNELGLKDCAHRVITRTCPTCKNLKLFNVTVKRDDGKQTVVTEVPARDAWAARTTVHFFLPPFWCGGHLVDYSIKEA